MQIENIILVVCVLVLVGNLRGEFVFDVEVLTDQMLFLSVMV